jgi:hypothetical protein
MSELKTVSGVVASKSRKGNSIKVGDDWYSTFNASDLSHVNWKDTVSFSYVLKGEYRNIKGKVKITATDDSPKSKGGYSNLGVELGHASKLAMDMSTHKFAADDVGSPEFYKFWMNETQTIHKAMSALRTRMAEPKAEAKEEVIVKKTEPEDTPTMAVTEEDLF